VDLDRFQAINDALGRRAGDEVLAQVATRLARCTRRGDVVARIGGDEFLLLLTDISGDAAPSKVAAKIHRELTEPFRLAGRDYWVSASVGISVFPRDGEDPTSLMSHADLALGQAKAGGRSQVQFYSESLNEVSRRRHVQEQGLRRALEGGGLRLVYQPIFDARTLEIVAAEALLRWNDPDLGFVAPSEFISVAEDTGLIVPLGEAVLRTACEQLAQWKREGHRLRVTVNLSAHQIDEVRLRQLVVQALWDADLQPGELELEVTETALMQNEQAAARTIAELKRIGVGISLDDFGTGFSSLSYLKRFPVDTVKIDRSFVRDLTFDPDDAAIVAAIVSIARQLDLRVVAEGVETEEQRLFLTERMCSHLQGFLLCAPLPPEELGQRLTQGPLRLDEKATDWL
jgi:diguanylate cyclase (GGDEF)-like protein